MVRFPAAVALPLIFTGTLAAECADAGICRLDARATGSGDRRWHAGVTLGYASGDGGEDLRYTTAIATIGVAPWPGGEVRLELPVVAIDGRRGDEQGVGDALAIVTQRLCDCRWGGFTARVGILLPTGDDDALPGLPQGYQPGLGATDVLLGVGWRWEMLRASVGYQIAGGANDLSGVHLERGDDLAVALGLTHAFGDWTPEMGLVAIERLDESIVDDGAGGRMAVADSDGLQVNLRARLAWRPSSTWTFALGGAKALLERESDVDGLTRSWAVDVGASLAF